MQAMHDTHQAACKPISTNMSSSSGRKGAHNGSCVAMAPRSQISARVAPPGSDGSLVSTCLPLSSVSLLHAQVT